MRSWDYPACAINILKRFCNSSRPPAASNFANALGTYAGVALRGQDALCVVLGSESTDRSSGRVSAQELPVPAELRPGPS